MGDPALDKSEENYYSLQGGVAESAFNIQGLKLGVIIAIKKRQAGGILIDVDDQRGGTLQNVPMVGGAIDLITYNMHGVFIPPRIGQYAVIGFIDARYDNPVCVNTFTVPAVKYKPVNDAAESNINVNKIVIGHASGSSIVLNEDGTVDINGKGIRFNSEAGISIDATNGFNLASNSLKLGEGIDAVAVKGSKVVMDAGGDAKTFFDWLDSFYKLFEQFVQAVETSPFVATPQDGGLNALTTFKSNITTSFAPLLAAHLVKYPLTPGFAIGEVVNGKKSVRI